jgi:hypothetical protein
MELITVHVERTEPVQVELRLDGRWYAVGPAFHGVGETPAEAKEDYRLKLQAETFRVMETVQTFQRRGRVELVAAGPSP